MAVLSLFTLDFESYLSLWISKTNTNQRQAEYREETLRKLHGYHDAFMLNGLDGDYTKALSHYQTMLTLLGVVLTDPEWNIDIEDLQIFFGSIHSFNNQAFQTTVFANPLVLDVPLYKNWICTVIGDTTISLDNLTNGDSGQIKLIMDSTGGYTIGLDSSFTLKGGDSAIETTADSITVITWSYDGADIMYVITPLLTA